MTHPNEELLTRFYEAFSRHDGDAMAACYADDAHFSDPVFVGLTGTEAGGMWRMLTSRASDLRVEFSGIEADDASGRAHWEAWYTFSPTGRKVHNIIDARFRFQDGKIVEHIDEFDFGRWSRQAIGLPALLLGWTGAVQKKVRRTAGAQLQSFLASPTRN